MRQWLPPNPMHDKLLAGETACGTFVFSSDPAITEIVGLAGYDAAIIDFEHAATDVSALAGHARAAHAAGASCWVRVGSFDPLLISRSLDAGAQGVILPHFGVDTAASKNAASMLRYSPDGTRPTCTGTRSSGYGQGDFSAYVRRSNQQAMAIGLIEDAHVVDHINEVLDQTGVGIVMPGGAGDLATSLGVHGQGNHPMVLEAIARVHAAVRARPHLRIGAYVSSLDALPELQAMGFDFYIYAIDYKVLAEAYRQAYRKIVPDSGT